MNPQIIATLVLAGTTTTLACAGDGLEIDGILDAGYGAPISIQGVNTSFGDNDNPDSAQSFGSEIDAAYATVVDGRLHVMLTGNLQDNFNKLVIFIDASDGGQQTLRTDNVDVDFNGLNRMGGNIFSGPGLTFDEGFAPDYFLSFSTNTDSDPAGTGLTTINASAAQLLTDGGGLGGYVGNSNDNPNGSGGILSDTGIEIAIDNSNIAGVLGGEDEADQKAASAVQTGMEFALPLGLLTGADGTAYVPGSGMRLCAFILSPDYQAMSNQVVGSLPAPASDAGDPRQLDFRSLDGCQFAAFDGDSTDYPCGCGDCGGGGGEPPASSVVTDGFADDSYGAALVVQDTQTGFGDANLGLSDLCNGSELDGLYGFVDDERLNILVAGNLESNYNKLQIFVDYIDGGQNRLRGDNPGVSFNGLNVMGDDGSGNGLQFDAEFSPDLWFSADCGGDSDISVNASIAQILTDGGGVGAFVGSASVDGGSILNPNGVEVALNNSNVLGVDSGSGLSDGSGVLTGMEISIPLDLLVGFSNGADIKVCAFITGSGHDFMSNQVLGGLGGSENLAQSNLVDFSVIDGDQFVLVGEGGGQDCTGDLDGDFIIGGADLTLLLGSWGSKSATADLDGDGIVTGADLTILLGFWGQPCD